MPWSLKGLLIGAAVYVRLLSSKLLRVGLKQFLSLQNVTSAMPLFIFLRSLELHHQQFHNHLIPRAFVCPGILAGSCMPPFFWEGVFAALSSRLYPIPDSLVTVGLLKLHSWTSCLSSGSLENGLKIGNFPHISAYLNNTRPADSHYFSTISISISIYTFCCLGYKQISFLLSLSDSQAYDQTCLNNHVHLHSMVVRVHVRVRIARRRGSVPRM